MAAIGWKEEYSVGVTEFDADHKRLIELINALDEARERNRDSVYILQAVETLIAYTKGHFAREEELMLRTGYPGYESHVEKHESLKKRIVDFHQSVKSGEVKQVEDEILKFLYNWLIYHILNEDKAYSAFFNYHGYHSIFDEPQAPVGNLFSRMSIRALSYVSLALVALVMISSAVAGWVFLTGINEVRSFYEDVGPRTVRKLRVADFLYSRFLPDAAYGTFVAGGPDGQGVETRTGESIKAALQQVDEALEFYHSLEPSGRERELLTTVRQSSEGVTKAATAENKPAAAGNRIAMAKVWEAVTELNRLAYDGFQEAEQRARARIDHLSAVVRWVAGVNTALILGLGLYGFWFSRRWLVEPLAAVTGALSRLASGDTEADVPRMARGDEIGKLIDAFKILRRSALDRNWAQREQERLSEEITWRRANHDHVTGLLNRTLFHDRLEHTMALARRGKRPFALLFIDLDLFKQVNDTMGHDAGDELLRGVARRLNSCVRESDTVARLGGDEFGVILTEFGDAAAVIQVAQRILEALQRPFGLTKGMARIGASIGIAMFPEDGSDAAILVANADAAMYRAKQAGRNTYRMCGGLPEVVGATTEVDSSRGG